MHLLTVAYGRVNSFFQCQQETFIESPEDKPGDIFKVMGIPEIVPCQLKGIA